MSILLVLAAVFGSLAATYAAIESQTFANRLQSLESRGSNVIQFGAANPQAPVSISRNSCEALARRTGVERAGLLEALDSRDIGQFGRRTPMFGASSSLFPALSSNDAIIGTGLTASQSDTYVRLEPGGTHHLIVGSFQPEGVPTNNALVFPLAPAVQSTGSCIVITQRFANPQAMIQLLAPQLEAEGGKVAGKVQLAQSIDPVADWVSRPLQYLALMLGLGGGVVQALLTWTRSSEVAAYRLSGTSKVQLAWLLTLEAILCAGTFATAASAAVFSVRDHVNSPSTTVLWSLCGGIAWLLASVPGLVGSVVSPASSLARER